jgi:hypothetical protein
LITLHKNSTSIKSIYFELLKHHQEKYRLESTSGVKSNVTPDDGIICQNIYISIFRMDIFLQTSIDKYDHSLSVDYFPPVRLNLSGDSSSEGGRA